MTTLFYKYLLEFFRSIEIETGYHADREAAFFQQRFKEPY
jgi:hypothetical protein